MPLKRQAIVSPVDGSDLGEVALASENTLNKAVAGSRGSSVMGRAYHQRSRTGAVPLQAAVRRTRRRNW